MENKWKSFLESNKWSTYLAYQLKENSSNPIDTLLKYEALLTQCSYLSRMAYCPADIFCRMTHHLDITPNAFNNYIRAIEKIYERLFNYKCSFDTQYIQEHLKFKDYFNPIGGSEQTLQNNSKKSEMTGGVNFEELKQSNKVGFFVQNKEHMGAYLYVYNPPETNKFNDKKTLFITFKGSSNIIDFQDNILGVMQKDIFLSELDEGSNTSVEIEKTENPKNTQPKNPKNTQNTQNPKNIQNTQNPQSTQNIQNLKNPQNITQGKGANEFIKILKASIKDLCSKIDILKSHKFQRVIITGHSLGGALASLFGYYLKRYKPNLVSVPIHVITFGACCVFDANGRNEFNEFLNISGPQPVFTLDRVTSNFDPMIVLPPDLEHPGYTLLRDEMFAFSNTGRTNEIGEIRKMLGLEEGYDGNDLLLSSDFVKLFTNKNDFMGTGRVDTDLYREKFRIKFGTNAKEQQLILEKAMPDADSIKIRELFKTIESETGDKRYNSQKGGLYNPFSKKKKSEKLGKEQYKIKTQTMMPNQIQYSCYKIMSFGFCHATYMGVSYVMVLRLPNIKGGYKEKNPPVKDYTLYEKNGSIFSLSDDSYITNNECKKGVSNNQNSLKNKGNNKRSVMNKFTGFLGLKKTPQNRAKNNIKEKLITDQIGSTASRALEDIGGIFSKCSIL